MRLNEQSTHCRRGWSTGDTLVKNTHNQAGDRRPDPTYVRASETAGTHLAHWPPPFHGREAQPVIMKHRRGEPIKRAKPRGWRLTRAMFSEFQEDE
jgi:hypothetical protein